MAASSGSSPGRPRPRRLHTVGGRRKTHTSITTASGSLRSIGVMPIARKRRRRVLVLDDGARFIEGIEVIRGVFEQALRRRRCERRIDDQLAGRAIGELQGPKHFELGLRGHERNAVRARVARGTRCEHE